MTQIRISNAYNTLIELSNYKFNIEIVRNLYFLIKQLEDIHKFGMEKERELLEKYNVTFDDNGVLNFKDQSVLSNFIKDRTELYDLKYDLDIPPVEIKTSDCPDLKISAKEYMALDGFVKFIIGE